jgi:hypothetical protein
MNWSTSLRGAASLRLAATVTLGADRGQPLGTVLQLRRGGEPVIGLGFPQVMNHFTRANPRMLAGFARSDAPLTHTATVLGSATKVRYRTAVFDGDLTDLSNLERFDEASGEWLPLPADWAGLSLRPGEHLYSIQRIGPAVLAVSTERVICDGATIYEMNTLPWGACAFWHDGWLHVCCPFYGEIRSFVWSPGSGPVGVPALTYALGPHYGRAFGVLGGKVLMATHAGGLHRFDGVAWDAVQWSFPGEFYALAQVGETLRLGDYGTGDQWLYDPALAPVLQKLGGNPPAEPGAQKASGREIQSFALHGGALYHGVYPWGAVHWRDLLNWTWGHQRLVSGPPIDAALGAFTADLTAQGVDPGVFPGISRWCQRITALTAWRGGIVASCTNMPGDLILPTSAQTAMLGGLHGEYGRTMLLEGPCAAAGEIAWADAPTELAIEIEAGRLTLRQDGAPIAEVPGLAPADLAAGDLTLEVGRGQFGSFGGQAIRGVSISAG